MTQNRPSAPGDSRSADWSSWSYVALLMSGSHTVTRIPTIIATMSRKGKSRPIGPMGISMKNRVMKMKMYPSLVMMRKNISRVWFW